MRSKHGPRTLDKGIENLLQVLTERRKVAEFQLTQNRQLLLWQLRAIFCRHCEG
jgi:hypothetical protein